MTILRWKPSWNFRPECCLWAANLRELQFGVRSRDQDSGPIFVSPILGSLDPLSKDLAGPRLFTDRLPPALAWQSMSSSSLKATGTEVDASVSQLDGVTLNRMRRNTVEIVYSMIDTYHLKAMMFTLGYDSGVRRRKYGSASMQCKPCTTRPEQSPCSSGFSSESIFHPSADRCCALRIMPAISS